MQNCSNANILMKFISVGTGFKLLFPARQPTQLTTNCPALTVSAFTTGQMARSCQKKKRKHCKSQITNKQRNIDL